MVFDDADTKFLGFSIIVFKKTDENRHLPGFFFVFSLNSFSIKVAIFEFYDFIIRKIMANISHLPVNSGNFFFFNISLIINTTIDIRGF